MISIRRQGSSEPWCRFRWGWRVFLLVGTSKEEACCGWLRETAKDGLCESGSPWLKRLTASRNRHPVGRSSSCSCKCNHPAKTAAYPCASHCRSKQRAYASQRLHNSMILGTQGPSDFRRRRTRHCAKECRKWPKTALPTPIRSEPRRGVTSLMPSDHASINPRKLLVCMCDPGNTSSRLREPSVRYAASPSTCRKSVVIARSRAS